jgi:four helix bundle protein
MNADDLKKRTKQFGLRILKLVGALPNTVQGRAIGGQLVRSGTSVGANYRAACRGRSKAEFVAKLGVVEEEADESAYWLEMIVEGELLKSELVKPLLTEATELTKIMASSRISASSNPAQDQKRLAIETGNKVFDLPKNGIPLEAVERDLIIQAMERTDFNITKAAKLLGLTLRTLQYRLEKFGIKRNRQSAIGNWQ